MLLFYLLFKTSIQCTFHCGSKAKNCQVILSYVNKNQSSTIMKAAYNMLLYFLCKQILPRLFPFLNTGRTSSVSPLLLWLFICVHAESSSARTSSAEANWSQPSEVLVAMQHCCELPGKEGLGWETPSCKHQGHLCCSSVGEQLLWGLGSLLWWRQVGNLYCWTLFCFLTISLALRVVKTLVRHHLHIQVRNFP